MKEMVVAKFGVPSWNLPEWLEENHKDLRQHCQNLG
jgi:hypothetical protein